MGWSLGLAKYAMPSQVIALDFTDSDKAPRLRIPFHFPFGFASVGAPSQSKVNTSVLASAWIHVEVDPDI